MNTPAQKRFDELWAERSTRLWTAAESEELLDLIRAGAKAPDSHPAHPSCLVSTVSSRVCEHGTKSCVVAHHAGVTVSGSPSPETAKALGEMIGLVQRTPDEQAAHNHVTWSLFEKASDKIFAERADLLKRLADGNTPLTDAEEGIEVYDKNGNAYVAKLVTGDFARKLERELATATTALQHYADIAGTTAMEYETGQKAKEALAQIAALEKGETS